MEEVNLFVCAIFPHRIFVFTNIYLFGNCKRFSIHTNIYLFVCYSTFIFSSLKKEKVNTMSHC